MKVDSPRTRPYAIVFRDTHYQFRGSRCPRCRGDLNPRIGCVGRPSQITIERHIFRPCRVKECQFLFGYGILGSFLADFQIIGINSRRRALPLLPVSVEIDIAHAHVLGGVRLHGKRDLVARSRSLKPIDIGAQVELGRVRLHRKGLRRSGCRNPQRDIT